MLRFVDVFMFVSPILLFIAWRVSARAGIPSSRVVAASFIALAAVLASLLWFQREGALPSHTAYVPAQLQNGRIVPGHGAAPP